MKYSVTGYSNMGTSTQPYEAMDTTDLMYMGRLFPKCAGRNDNTYIWVEDGSMNIPWNSVDYKDVEDEIIIDSFFYKNNKGDTVLGILRNLSGSTLRALSTIYEVIARERGELDIETPLLIPDGSFLIRELQGCKFDSLQQAFEIRDMLLTRVDIYEIYLSKYPIGYFLSGKRDICIPSGVIPYDCSYKALSLPARINPDGNLIGMFCDNTVVFINKPLNEGLKMLLRECKVTTGMIIS